VVTSKSCNPNQPLRVADGKNILARHVIRRLQAVEIIGSDRLAAPFLNVPVLMQRYSLLDFSIIDFYVSTV
jgi:hypothetical protein